ncbi:SMI1/KNR4 family protein [Streptomyces sp. NPDC050418]|uniref:SMI1/KNR4 family protein n=1 Tax=Streptomyces sp. NPDC050418 TaxID=3365612 RepID=UPI003799BB07
MHAFEAERGIVLPEPYRTVVAEICDGTAEETGPPFYGLVPVAEEPDDWDDPAGGRDLTRPFPLTKAVRFEGDGEELWEDDEEPIFNDGSVVLGTDGCGMYWHLIVTGPSRGHVWRIDEFGATPFGAEFGHTTGEAGFAGWVRHWSERTGGLSSEGWFDAEEGAVRGE